MDSNENYENKAGNNKATFSYDLYKKNLPKKIAPVQRSVNKRLKVLATSKNFTKLSVIE